VGWGKDNTFSCGAFCEAKNEIRRRNPRSRTLCVHYGARSEGGQKFLPRRVAKRLLRGVPPNPLPFCPPERKLSKVSVGIFSEKSSDFVQETQPICKVSVSRLARGFAPRFGGRIFKQFLNEPILFRPKGESKATIYPPKADSAQKRLQIKI